MQILVTYAHLFCKYFFIRSVVLATKGFLWLQNICSITNFVRLSTFLFVISSSLLMDVVILVFFYIRLNNVFWCIIQQCVVIRKEQKRWMVVRQNFNSLLIKMLAQMIFQTGKLFLHLKDFNSLFVRLSSLCRFKNKGKKNKSPSLNFILLLLLKLRWMLVWYPHLF